MKENSEDARQPPVHSSYSDRFSPADAGGLGPYGKGYVYVCMYVCMYVCVFAHIPTRTPTPTYVYKYMFVRGCPLSKKKKKKLWD